MTDNVHRPEHYTQGAIECIDAIEAATIGKSGFEGALVANVIKYLWRYERKGGSESVRKARWYLDRLEAHLAAAEQAADGWTPEAVEAAALPAGWRNTLRKRP